MQHILEKPSSQRGDAKTRQPLLRLAWRVFPMWGMCLVIGCIALAFNLYRLGAPSIWFDEVLSVERARQSLPVLWQIIFSTQPNMALYYIVLHFWLAFIHLFGLLPTEFVVRFPSAVFAACSAIMLWLLGRRFLGNIAGLVGTILYILNFQQLIYAQDTRSYSMQLLLLAIAWYAFFAALSAESHQKRWWIVYSLVSVLAVYTHVFSLLILFTQAIVFACLLILPTPWRGSVRKQFLPAIVTAFATCILLIPILLVSLHGGRTEWLPVPDLNDAVHVLLYVGNGNRPYLLLVGVLCMLGVVGVVIAWLPGVAARIPILADEQKTARLRSLFPVTFALVCWCVVPFILSYVISQGQTHLFSSRYLVVIVPPLLLLAGLGVGVIGDLGWRRVQIGLVPLAVIIASLVVPLYYQSAEVENWRDAAFWIQQQYQSGDGMTCYNNDQGCQISIDYYFRTYPKKGISFPTDAPGSFSWVTYDLTNDPGVPNDATDTKALASYGAKHQRVFYIVGRLDGDDDVARVQNAQRWLDSHYHFVKQVTTSTVTVRLYETR